MVYIRIFILLVLPLSFSSCSSMEIGSAHDSEPNGSYAGSTLNSPVTDQNPHVGGDQSYPASTDSGKPLATPDRMDGR